jgi:hypothetical protein
MCFGRHTSEQNVLRSAYSGDRGPGAAGYLFGLQDAALILVLQVKNGTQIEQGIGVLRLEQLLPLDLDLLPVALGKIHAR